MPRDEEPPLGKKVLSYGTLIVAGALVGAAVGFGGYVELVAPTSRRSRQRVSEEERDAARHDGGVVALFLVVGAISGAGLAAFALMTGEKRRSARA